MNPLEPRKNCIICLKEIYRTPTFRKLRLRRSAKSVTCSKRCSGIYSRVRNYVNVRCYRKLKKKFIIK